MDAARHAFINPGSSFRGLHDPIVNHLGNRESELALTTHEILWGHEGVKTVADLAGKKIGVSAPCSQPDLFARALLAKQGIKPNAVTFVSSGSDSERIAALAAGAIDAAPASGEFSAKAEEIGAHPVTRAADELPEAMRRCLYVSGRTLAERPCDVAAFLAAEHDAYTYALAHRDETLALTREVAKLKPYNTEPELVFDEVVDQKVVSPAFKVDLAKLTWQRDPLASLGSINAGFNPATMVDTTALAASNTLVGQ